MKKDEIIHVLQEHCKISEEDLISLGIKKRKEKALVTRLTESQKKWLCNYCYKKKLTERDFFLRAIYEIIMGKENFIEMKNKSYEKNTENLNKICNFMLDEEIAELFKQTCKENGIKQYSRALRGYCLIKMESEER